MVSEAQKKEFGEVLTSNLDRMLEDYEEYRQKLVYLEKDIRMYMSELYNIEHMGQMTVSTSGGHGYPLDQTATIECRMNDRLVKQLTFDYAEDHKLYNRMLKARQIFQS